MRRTVLFLVLGGLVSACSGSTKAYSGADRPASQVATILPENAWNRARASIAPTGSGQVGVRVAGRRLSFMKSRFTVLPGRHALTVVYVNQDTPWEDYILKTKPVSLTLDAQAGRTYAIRGQPSYAKDRVDVRIFAVDAGSGRTVAQVAVPQASVILDNEEP